jgi:nucleoside-diphosphate-sugar epimerase
VNVLVTGGAGYVGSTLLPQLLARGHRVRVLDALLHGGHGLLGVWADPAFEFRRGDVRDRRMVREAVQGMDAVVHLAAIVGDPACARNPELARAVNLDASVALIDACRRAGAGRLVFASTCSNYGRMADADTYLEESSALAPVSLYAETKVDVEHAILEAACDGFCATPLRFATVFGASPRMRFDLTVNEFTAELLTTGKLVVFGEQFWRPYVHVRDAARAIVAVLDADPVAVSGEVFNVGATEENYQKQQLVELIRPCVPRAEVEYVHRAEDPRDYRVSFTKIRQQLGFEITRRVPDGIREVAALITSGAIADLSHPSYRN